MNKKIDISPYHTSIKRKIKKLNTIAFILLALYLFSYFIRFITTGEFTVENDQFERSDAYQTGRLIGRNLALIISLVLLLVSFLLKMKLKQISTPNIKQQARMDDPEKRKKYLR